MNIYIIGADRKGDGAEARIAARELGPIFGSSRIITDGQLPIARGERAIAIAEAAADQADLTVFLPGWWFSRRARVLWDYCRFSDNPRALAVRTRDGAWTLLMKAAYFRPQAVIGRRL